MGLANKSLSVKGEVVSAYIASLEASIINQSSLRDVERLRLPVHIIYGTLDPLVVGAHIQSLQATRSTITTQKIVAGHEVVGRFARTLVAALRAE